MYVSGRMSQLVMTVMATLEHLVHFIRLSRCVSFWKKTFAKVGGGNMVC